MPREIVTGLIVVVILQFPVGAAPQKEDEPTHPSARAALQYFESVPATDFDAFLRHTRPPAPSPAVRAMVLRDLPEEGNLTPTDKEAAKLANVLPVLASHGRATDLELRLVTVGGTAVAGLHARAVLLISREALGLLDTEEVMALTAHELGHDYVWDAYEAAQKRSDHRTLQQLELRCDGIAVMTLNRLHVDVGRLISAARKLAHYNQRVIGPTRDARYVPLDERTRFIRAVADVVRRRFVD